MGYSPPEQGGKGSYAQVSVSARLRNFKRQEVVKIGSPDEAQEPRPYRPQSRGAPQEGSDRCHRSEGQHSLLEYLRLLRCWIEHHQAASMS